MGAIRVSICSCFMVLGGIIHPFSAFAVIIPDFQVNPPDTAFIWQMTTDIAFQPNGNFVVVWEDRGKDNDNRQVYFRRYDSLGNPLGSVVQVSDTSTGFFNQQCRIAIDSAGNFAICYASAKFSGVDSTSGWYIYLRDIWVRIYSFEGQPLTSAIKVDIDRPDPIQNPGGYSEVSPEIACHRSGKFVVGWAEEIFSDTVPFPKKKRIYCQFFDANGQRMGNNIWASEIDTGEAKVNNTFAEVGMTDNGYVLVSWEGLVKKSDGYVYSLPVGSLFFLDGTNLRRGFLIIHPNDPIWAGAGFIDVNVTSNNDFVVACKARDILGTYPNGTIVVLRLDSLGNQLSQPQSAVDTLNIGDPFTMPKVKAGSNGYVVIWSDRRTLLDEWAEDRDRNLMAQKFDYNDQSIGRNYRINGPFGSLQQNWMWYDLDFSSQDKVAFAWSDFRNFNPYHYDIYSKIFDLSDIGSYLSGDLNQDGKANITDVIFLVNYVFKGGMQPSPLFLADVNADCKVNLSDIIYLVNYVFKGGTSPKQGCAY